MPAEKNKLDRAVQAFMRARKEEGCMCRRCQQDREGKAEPEIFKELYPELEFVPTGLPYLCYGDRIDKLQYIINIKKSNEVVLKERQVDDNDLWYCRSCGKLHDAETSTENNNNEHYCARCMRSLFVCYDCGEMKHVDNNYIVRIGRKKEHVCLSCYEDNYRQCNSCFSHFRKRRLNKFEYGRTENGVLKYMYLCAKCSRMSKVKCVSCGKDTQREVAVQKNRSIFCPVCAEREKGLHTYFYKPLQFNFATDPNEGLVSPNAFHIGFELEVASYSSFIEVGPMTHMIKEQVGKQSIYCMHDGTIRRATGHEGMEIVSHPFTWQRYRKKDIDKWDHMLLYLRSKGWKADLPGIGFHVHTTKAAWGTHQIYKLLHLVYRNQSFIAQIAQREPTKHCVMRKEDFDEAVLVAKDKKNRQRDHYSAINLNSNNGMEAAETIEFRIFQGTLEPLYFHKNLEFVYACHNFTREYVDMSKTRFLNYVEHNRRLYPCLSEFITMKGIK